MRERWIWILALLITLLSLLTTVATNIAAPPGQSLTPGEPSNGNSTATTFSPFKFDPFAWLWWVLNEGNLGPNDGAG